MEEDIKYLEEQIKSNNELFEKHGYSLLSQKQIQALENLIKGYRELEKRIIQLTNLLCINDSDENYIPKSKVKEKIEELKEREQELSDEEGYWGSSDLLAQIEVLQELMEDK